MLLSSSIHSRASARQELSSPWRAAGSRARATLPRIPDLRPSGSSRWPSHERVLPLANTLLVLQISVACVLYGSFVLLGHVVRLIVYVEIPQVSFLINQLQIAVASTRNHTKMITDSQLYSLAIFLGSAAMLLIVLYHFLEVNSEDHKTEEIPKSTAGKVKA